MSVTVDKRTPTEPRFETGEKFKALAIYTVQICKNEKHFPKRDRWMLTQQIVNTAIKAYGNVTAANGIEVKTLRDYELRREYQVKARAKLKKLAAYAEIAYAALNLGEDRLGVMAEYIKSCMDILSAWRASDRKRYRNLLPAREKDGNAEKARP